MLVAAGASVALYLFPAVRAFEQTINNVSMSSIAEGGATPGLLYLRIKSSVSTRGTFFSRSNTANKALDAEQLNVSLP